MTFEKGDIGELSAHEEDILLEDELERWRDSKEYKEEHKEKFEKNCFRCEKLFEEDELDLIDGKWACWNCEKNLEEEKEVENENNSEK